MNYIKKIILLFLVLIPSLIMADYKLSFASNDITSKDFTINTWDFWIWLGSWNNDTPSEKINFAWATFIEKALIAMASISVLIMILGWIYMILNLWKEEYLTKWKDIFMAWLYSVAIALASYVLVAMLTYILYS